MKEKKEVGDFHRVKKFWTSEKKIIQEAITKETESRREEGGWGNLSIILVITLKAI